MDRVQRCFYGCLVLLDRLVPVPGQVAKGAEAKKGFAGHSGRVPHVTWITGK